ERPLPARISRRDLADCLRHSRVGRCTCERRPREQRGSLPCGGGEPRQRGDRRDVDPDRGPDGRRLLLGLREARFLAEQGGEPAAGRQSRGRADSRGSFGREPLGHGHRVVENAGQRRTAQLRFQRPDRQESMSRAPAARSKQCGSGLVEVMISVVIGMLLVLVVYQIHQVSNAQKRTIVSDGNASQNASYATYLIGREISMAGSAIASSATVLDGCTLLAPFTAAQLPGGLRAIPVLIDAGANDKTPDRITVFYGGSSTLSTPVAFKKNSTVPALYEVAGAVAFSQGDVIAAVSGAQCTLSTVDAGGVSVVDPCMPPTCSERIATLTHTPIPGSPAATYASGGVAALVNLGPATAFARVVYSVDPDCAHDATQCTLRSQNILPLGGPDALAPPVPIVADVVNLKAEYGLD